MSQKEEQALALRDLALIVVKARGVAANADGITPGSATPANKADVRSTGPVRLRQRLRSGVDLPEWVKVTA